MEILKKYGKTKNKLRAIYPKIHEILGTASQGCKNDMINTNSQF